MTAAPGPVIIGLDVGTTAVKAVGFSPGSPWRCSAQRDLTLLSPDPAHRVQDPDSITVALAEALTEVVAACDSGQVIGVSLATAMHGLIGLGSDHRPLTPLITWADGRAGDEAMDLIRSGQADELHRMSGTPVHPMSPLTKLLWFSRHEPETLRRVRWWGGVKEVVLHWLTGEVATELSSASGTGLLDLTTGGWSEPAMEVVGVGAHQLPPILATTAKLGLGPAAAARVGLREGTPVIVGAADGPLGNVGTGALDRGVAGLSLGTSAAVRTVVGRPDPHLLRGRPGLFSYAITDDRWVMGGAISNGGSVSRWAVDTLLDGEPGEVDDDDLIELASDAPPGPTDW